MVTLGIVGLGKATAMRGFTCTLVSAVKMMRALSIEIRIYTGRLQAGLWLGQAVICHRDIMGWNALILRAHRICPKPSQDCVGRTVDITGHGLPSTHCHRSLSIHATISVCVAWLCPCYWASMDVHM